MERKMTEDKKLKNIRLAVKHLVNAQDCGSHVKYYIEKDIPDALKDIQDAIDSITKTWSLLAATKLAKDHPEILPSPLRVGKAVWFVMSPRG